MIIKKLLTSPLNEYILLLNSSNKRLQQIFKREFDISLLFEAILKVIARESAENYFNHLILKKSKLYQNKNEIKVEFEFIDKTILIIKYNCKKLSKTYYIHKN